MANNKIKGLTVEIGGDTTKLGQALDNVEKKTKSLSTELGQINRLLKMDPGNVDLLAQKQKVLAEAVANTREKLDKLKEAERQVQAQFERGEVSEEQVRALQREIIATENTLHKYENAAEETADAIEALGKSEEAAGESADDMGSGASHAASDVDDLGENAERASEGIKKSDIAFGAFIGTLASQAVANMVDKLKDLAATTVQIGMDFTSSMSEVQAISGATDEELASLEETARAFGATTVFSASEAAQALKYMSLAGWSAEESTNALEGVLNLAAASGMDLAEASDMVTDYLSAFGLEAKDSARFADMLSYAQSHSNTSAAQLGEAYKNVAANMHAAGQDVETTTALLSALADQGLKGSESGTALAAIMRDLTAKMKKGKISIGDTAVTVQDASGNFRDLTDILADVESATDGMGNAEKASALMTTFTADSIKGLNLVLNNGVKKISGFEKELRSANGSASKMSDTMNNNLSGDLKEMGSGFEELGLKIFDQLETPLRDATKFVTEKVIPMLTKISSWIFSNGPVIKSTIVGVTTAFVAYKAATVAATIAEEGLKGAIMATTVAQKALNLVQSASPWGLVAAGVAAVVAGLAVYAASMDDSKEKVDVLTESERELMAAANDAADSFRENMNTYNETAAGIQSQTKYTTDLAKELMGLADATGHVKEEDQARANFILGELSAATGVEYSMVDGMIQKYDEFKGSINEVIKAKEANLLLDAQTSLYTEAIQAKDGALQNLVLSEKDYQEQVRITAEKEEEYKNKQAELQNLWATAKTEADKRALSSQTLVLESMYQAWQSEEATLEEKKTAYDNAAADYGTYSDTIARYEEAQTAVMEGNYDRAVEILSSKGIAIGEYADTVDKKTREAIDALYKEAIDAGLAAKRTKENFEKGVKGYTKEMVSESEKAYEDALGAYADAYNDANGVGKDIGSGMVDGMESKRQSLIGKIRNLVSNIFSAARSEADSHSPSRKMIKVFEDIGEGGVVGLENTTQDIEAAAREQVRDVLDAYSGAADLGQSTYRAISNQATARQTAVAQQAAGDTATKLDRIIKAIEDGKILTIDGDTFVGATANRYDSALGQKRLLTARGAL